MRTPALLLALLLPLLARAQKTFTPELMWQLGRVGEEQLSPDGKLAVYTIARYDVAANKGEKDIYLVNTSKPGQSTRLTDAKGSEYQPMWRPDGKKIGYLAESGGKTQIWEMNADGTGKQATSTFSRDVEGFKYMPDGKGLIVLHNVKLDSTLSELYPALPAVKAKRMDGLWFRHWNAWHDQKYSHVFYAAYTDGKAGAERDLMPGERFDSPMEPFGGIDDVAGSPDGKRIVYTCKKLEGTAMPRSTNSDLYEYDLATGKTRNLTEGNKGYDQHPAYSADGKWLAWHSMERDGFEADKGRLMVMETATGSKRDLTAGFEEGIAGTPSWSKDNKGVYAAVHERGTDQIYYFDLTGKAAAKRVTVGRHNLSTVQAGQNGVLLSNRTAMEDPADLVTVDAKGKLTYLTKANEQTLAGVARPIIRERLVKTSDGKQMLVWMILPPGFDSTRRYPTLLFCQGGPQSPVSQSFSYRWNFWALSANGYIVVAPNRRGLPGFGRQWNDQISGDWGGQPMRDYLAAIDDAATLPYVNKDKLGAVGASYGGYSVYYLAGIHEKRFKAFASHCGVFDLESMYGTTEEMFFADWDLGGPYWTKPQPKTYQQFSPHRMVDKWDTPILVIHNELDFRVPIGQGMEAFTAAQVRGIPSRFLYFPDEGHWVLKPQNSITWNRELIGWLDGYLK